MLVLKARKLQSFCVSSEAFNMDTQLHVAPEIQDLQAGNLLITDGDFSAPSCSLMEVNNQKPAKKPTRQWAAWTRQEEENFFNALRQVGKNFEEITCQVQSKNRNQVRHYYYRLVRRMNKLLGPGLCLDAKNSKDANAAMLRWWSLLEKHSCAASKLHLKPRKFKMFIEALGNQLLKDRNKSRRKRPCHGDKYFSVASVISVPIKELGNAGRPVVESPNNQKIEADKGPSLKRSTSKNTNFSKGELPPTRVARKKRRPDLAGLVASAAYKRWEKAAIAGVSLVADAAEQLERATNGGNCSVDQGAVAGQKDSDFIGNSGGHLSSSTHHQTDNATIQPSVKLKLQLFPIDEVTRQALEKDACNPYLELIISGRKRISSIVEHLNRKWGNSSIASGELMLFPYSAQQKGVDQQRWTAKDITSTAADVYATVGSPTVFRLRYGWFSNIEPVMGIDQIPSPPHHCDVTMHSEDFQGGFELDVPNGEKCNVELAVGQEVSSGTRNILSAGDWADSLTNISIGDLLSEASRAAKSSCVDSSIIRESIQYPQENPFSCDSLDAAIAAHTSQACPTSLWNADETCDEFSFQNSTVKSRESSLSQFTEDNRQTTFSTSLFQSYFKELTITGSSSDPSCGKVLVELEAAKEEKDGPPKDVNFMDIYWPDSLGPFDLEMPSANRYQGQDIVFGEGDSFGCYVGLD